MSLISMESIAVFNMQVIAPAGATLEIITPLPGDQIKVDGAPMPSPARVMPGTHSIGLMTNEPGVREIRITANM
jgi:hypothetical protein